MAFKANFRSFEMRINKETVMSNVKNPYSWQISFFIISNIFLKYEHIKWIIEEINFYENFLQRTHQVSWNSFGRHTVQFLFTQ